MLSAIIMARPTFPCFIFFFYNTQSRLTAYHLFICLRSSTLECARAEAGPGSAVGRCVTRV